MKKLTIVIILSLFASILITCKKDTQANIKINVRDNKGNPVEGVEVNLYKSERDMDLHINQVRVAKFTNIQGYVLFENLDPIEYYLATDKLCYSNVYSSVAANLSEGETNEVTTMIYEHGSINLINFSTNPYRIYFNDVEKFDMPGKSASELITAAAFYKIRALQLSGYLVFPTDLTFNGDVNCYKPLDVVIP